MDRAESERRKKGRKQPGKKTKRLWCSTKKKTRGTMIRKKKIDQKRQKNQNRQRQKGTIGLGFSLLLLHKKAPSRFSEMEEKEKSVKQQKPTQKKEERKEHRSMRKNTASISKPVPVRSHKSKLRDTDKKRIGGRRKRQRYSYGKKKHRIICDSKRGPCLKGKVDSSKRRRKDDFQKSRGDSCRRKWRTIETPPKKNGNPGVFGPPTNSPVPRMTRIRLRRRAVYVLKRTKTRIP